MKVPGGALALALLSLSLSLSLRWGRRLSAAMATAPHGPDVPGDLSDPDVLNVPGDPDVPKAPGDPDVPYVPGTLSAAFVTCPNETVAKELARAMVEKRLAACVNIVPQVTSIYEWKGKLEEDSEVLLMIKTRSSRIPALAEFVRAAHPYEVAELVALPVAQGNPPYLRWVGDSVPP